MSDELFEEVRTSDPVVDNSGRVSICEDRCRTCVFRAGNLMNLVPGRLQSMVKDALENQGHIVCHKTLNYGGDPDLPSAICHGFAQLPQAQQRSLALRLAYALKRVRWLNTKTGMITDSDEYDGEMSWGLGDRSA